MTPELRKIHDRAVWYGRAGLLLTLLATLVATSAVIDNRWDLAVVNGILFVAASALCIRSYEKARRMEDE